MGSSQRCPTATRSFPPSIFYSELYDPARLAANEVPVAAIVYHDDLYVDAGLSLDTAGEVGNLQHWVTNEFEHDGIRQDGKVFKRLLEMIRENGGPRLRG